MHAYLKIALLSVAASSAAVAHHSFAPHFDSGKPVRIVGTIVEYERRNPHAYLHLESVDENGLSREYVCESHGVTQLTRNGITPEMLAAGREVTVTGSQARRDPYMCFFDTVEFENGVVLSVNGPRDQGPTEGNGSPRLASEERRDSIYGTWLLVPARRSTSGPRPMMNFLTAAGQTAVEQYDPFVDDPTFRCDPVAIRRVWFAPGTPLEIRREGERIILRHEWMDVERVVQLDIAAHPADGPRSSLGHSIGRFDGDTLVIDTGNYSQGVLRQYVEMSGEPTRGLLHSDQLRTIERLSFDPEANRLRLTVEHEDPVFFARSFDPAVARYGPTDMELQPFGCQPENPDHSLIE